LEETTIYGGIAENLKRICKERGIKPYSLVKKGVKVAAITSIMEGRNTAIEGVYEVAQALGVAVEYLITGEASQAFMMHESEVGYGYTQEEQEYAGKLVRIMRTKMDGTVLAIKQNIDAFLTTPDRGEETKKTKAMAG